MKADFEPAPPVPPPLIDRLKQARKVLLAAHRNPDGDALGSMKALALGLNQLGIEAECYVTGKVTDNLRFLAPPAAEPAAGVDLAAFQALVILDCHLFERLGELGPVWESQLQALGARAPAALVVDHHQSDKPLPAGLSYHVPAASSTGELVFNLLAALGVELNREIAEALWVAITSDTGCFNFSSTTAASLRQASALVAAGAEPWGLAQRLTQNQPLRRLKLLGMALSGLRLELAGRVAVMVVTEAMLAATGSSAADSDGFVDYPRSLAGVQVAALVYPTEQGGCKVSMRAQDQVDVSQIAKFFGGGGHLRAAAYEDPGPPELAVGRFLAKMAELWPA